MYIAIICLLGCDVINFEINLIKPFFNLTKGQDKNLNILRTKRAFKDTHREKAPPNKTPTLSKSMNMDMSVVGTSNQLFIRLN